jgi:hypothetical protein
VIEYICEKIFSATRKEAHMKKVGKILLLFVLSMLITALVCAIPSAAEETAEVTE